MDGTRERIGKERRRRDEESELSYSIERARESRIAARTGEFDFLGLNKKSREHLRL